MKIKQILRRKDMPAGSILMFEEESENGKACDFLDTKR